MREQNSDTLVHDVIGRLFEEPEPLHRADLAEAAIAHGMAANRRRGFAVAGAALSVLAVVAGSVAVSGRGQNQDWSLGPGSGGNISPQAYEDSGPTYADRQREIVEQLATVFDAVLPAGVKTVSNETGFAAATFTANGDYLPEVRVRSGQGDSTVQFDSGDDSGYADAFAKTSAVPVGVTGGTVRVAVLPASAAAPGGAGYSAWYEFVPANAAERTFRLLAYGGQKNPVIDGAAFQKMVTSPGFAKLQELLDPSVPASAAAVRERWQIEAKVNAEAAAVLPPGFRLKLDPGRPGGLELVSPNGVNTFVWYAVGAGDEKPCPVAGLCYSADGYVGYTKLGPDGRARLGQFLWTDKAGKTVIVLQVFGKAGPGTAINPEALGKAVESAPQGPGLTPQQAMAIVRAPGAAKVIVDVQNLVAMP